MLAQIREARERQQPPVICKCNLFVFQMPGVGVGDEDGIESGGQRGVDVRAWGVADHPGLVCRQLELVEYLPVGGNLFFVNHYDLLEKMLEA